MQSDSSTIEPRVVWPGPDTTRVPYRVYLDPAVYEKEQKRIFPGDTWSFLGLETEIPSAADFKSTFVADTPIVLTRDDDGSVHAWVNRCAHRGAVVRRSADSQTEDSRPPARRAGHEPLLLRLGGNRR